MMGRSVLATLIAAGALGGTHVVGNLANRDPMPPAADDVRRVPPLPAWADEYEKETVITARGFVTGISLYEIDDDRTGVVVRVNGSGNIYYVYVGSEEHLHDSGLELKITDRVRITGSLRDREASRKYFVVADGIARSDASVRIRDADGTPRWND